MAKASLQEWETAFLDYDKDKSGSLDIMELKNLLLSKNCNISDSKIADMFIFMTGPQVTRDSKISKDQFLDGIRRIHDICDKVNALFRKYDADNNGFLSPPELRKLLVECSTNCKLTDETINEIITAADVNKDGQVSLQEFLQAIS